MDMGSCPGNTSLRHWLLVRCGDPEPSVARVHGSFAQWFRHALPPTVTLDVVDIRTETVSPAQLDAVSAVVVSGSSHAVYESHPWLPALDALIREVVSVRRMYFLGVCFGHQALARALGGEVTRNPRGREMGTIRVSLTPDGRTNPLFAALPTDFSAQATHMDTVRRPPPGATVLATSALDPCQSFAIHRAWGVQFHPEATADILRGYVRARADILRGEGVDPEALYASLHDTDTGRRLLDTLASLTAVDLSRTSLRAPALDVQATVSQE